MIAILKILEFVEASTLLELKKVLVEVEPEDAPEDYHDKDGRSCLELVLIVR